MSEEAESLRDVAVAALLTADATGKAAAARRLKARWEAGEIRLSADGPDMPRRPARPARPELLPPAAMPKRGRAGTARTRFALLHALAHIELNAIDLAVDMAGRWGPEMPPEFTSDWLRIADEEAQHFGLLSALLGEAGGGYGDLPAHDGLWEAAEATAHHLQARLAIVPQVLEARGLDVTPPMIERFRAAGDEAAARVLERILADEVTHVEAGNRWFRKLCADSAQKPEDRFRELVRIHFRGPVKPPFNDSARSRAGLTTDWYAALGSADSPSKP
ncbi:ferritin-like domain-containing protein [Sandaracinobacter sp. RS1-74]|uniref:ferritin-like domain-containing protein n=1 Tax=Sandaracinobacteroides sayramensis TaxID=2913411 RepID=UPI001EDB1BD9|nr:ferritin-like domain-containing protein [Sandaracinobacteroides sayramensis]MCG2842354.1 ferritin-like domain-containing protein [Sandaracinobacteroides sayramensis]